MASITSSHIRSDRVQKDGRRHIRYQCTVLDDVGETTTHRISKNFMPAGFDADADLVVQEGLLLAGLAQNEVDHDINEIINGNNPLRDDQGVLIPPRFSSYAAIVRKVLKYCLRHRNPLIVFRAVKLLDNVTDAQLKNLLSINDAKVARIRTLADKWRSLKADVDSYVPELEED